MTESIDTYQLLILLILIALLTYVLYAALYKDAASKHYDLSKRLYPHFLFPRKKETYIIVYKVCIIILLLLFVSLLIKSLL
jgi:hypothetical protein